MWRASIVVVTIVGSAIARAEPKELAYGPHPRNRLDFSKAESRAPAPLLMFFHGGGFRTGDKANDSAREFRVRALAKGIAFASANYRFLEHAPIQDILRDCARAVQYLRSRATDLNIDPEQIAAIGNSAGGSAALWLAFHDDLAQSTNEDPVLRQSSRLSAAVAIDVQFSLDLAQWRSAIGATPAGYNFAPFYGFASDDNAYTRAGKRVRADVDTWSLITADDPPVYLVSTHPAGPIKDLSHLLHHPKHALLLKQRCDKHGVPVIVDWTQDSKPPAETPAEFLSRAVSRGKKRHSD